ncbi:hypothetical protein V6R21_30515 [Limibacter armeniacum]|uniref:hypothetical protein n=1 Tax=Limibacter armeniacum TaxID=466084 RepID=UPI002FE640C7
MKNNQSPAVFTPSYAKVLLPVVEEHAIRSLCAYLYNLASDRHYKTRGNDYTKQKREKALQWLSLLHTCLTAIGTPHRMYLSVRYSIRRHAIKMLRQWSDFEQDHYVSIQKAGINELPF